LAEVMEQMFVAEMLWSSSLQQADLARVRAFLDNNGFKGVDVALSTPMTEPATRTRWATYYDAAGQCISTNYEMLIQPGWMFLKLVFCYSTASERDAGHADAVLVANALRMVFGVPIARELVLVGHYIKGAQDKPYYSDIGYASSFDNQRLNLFQDPPIEDAKLMSIPIEASTLLEKAFIQTYPHERFVLMWLAFEAVIHAHPGGGSNGEKRRRYFVNQLGSQIAGGEVNRLRGIRDCAFKEGKFEGGNFDQACWSLYAALQLAILEDCPQRAAYLKGYEIYISGQLGAGSA